MILSENDRNTYLESNAWPFQQAKAILEKIGHITPPKGYVLFETGYGPSGLPHIGTFGEVVRTIMVKAAFELISGIPTRFFCFSDDFDGMRKVPDTIPSKEEYIRYMGLPLSKIPDPFRQYTSYAQYMNEKLKAFLNSFGFQYEFLSATECYESGKFNDPLLNVLSNYDAIMDVMLPTLGADRQGTYSPFLPICKHTGKVLQVPVIDRNVKDGQILYKDPETGEKIWTSVKDGNCKLQWKPDFAMRWAAFDVDFEMYGKDHLVNGVIYTKLCHILGGRGPHQMFYELFLDQEGQKISKSKGTGLTVDEWLRYAPQESLSLFMYTSPQRAKKLYFDVIPKYVDDYIHLLKQYHAESDVAKRAANAVFHIHSGNPPMIKTNISYSLLLNLVSVCNTDNIAIISGYIGHYDPENLDCPFLQKMILGAINYYYDFVLPKKAYRAPTQIEREALELLQIELKKLENKSFNAESIQNIVYDIGNRCHLDLKTWFKGLYEILLGASQGPRFGSFIALYGIKETILLIENKLSASHSETNN